ncbi:WXG100 family type VII secretion target [Streptomyces albidus (ex Kaewkla and Franco 2022)]|uniref:WXG100 family type VII secretion target n=1 Tax=Streptomyces albidus (ex Kaewkla and Franco 2022) TaxID=722709 RepID=UPI0015EF2828|nr:hypothetical protein [Streptomyces albidus (ex Kaewkla and Franco 2022)]
MAGNEDGQSGGAEEQPRPEVPNVAPNLAVVELRRVMSSLPFFGTGGDGNLGKTSFEAHRLNQMIDLVENGRPSDMEHAGDALWKAGGAIRRAAEELSGHIDSVDWEGESGDAFRTWGRGLVKNSRKLADYSENAGTQIKASGSGLATVQKSMPPRDTRLVQKDVKDIPAPAQVEGNKEYAEAAKVEEDRQEAINQMNRLGSYYTVSNEIMAGQEPPTFGAMPNVGVPRPGPEDPRSAGEGEPSSTDSPGTVQSEARSATPDGGRETASVTTQGPTAVTPVPERNIGTEIDSVAAPPAPAPEVGTPPTTSPATPTAQGPSAGPVTPIAPGPTAQGLARSTAKAPGIAGTPRATGQGPVGPVGRTGQAGMARPGPMGRTANLGPGPGQNGMTGRPGARGMGPGMIGRTAGAGSMAAGQPTTPRASRPGGIVGGTPSRAVSGAKAPRIPRGTVVGNEGSTGKGGLRGTFGRVVGSTGAPSTPRAFVKKPAAGRGGVVGLPRSGGAGRGLGEFTPGGSGLARAGAAGGAMVPGGRVPTTRDEEVENGTRPDYLVEDEETWTTGRRGTVPPVIE